jgi:hypothetical protein
MEEQQFYEYLKNSTAIWYDPEESVFELNGTVVETPYTVWFVLVNGTDLETGEVL